MNKNINPRNDKGEPHGYWEYYFGQTLWYKCFYHNGKRHGYCESYSRVTKKKYKL